MATETPSITLITKRITRSHANNTNSGVEMVYICPPNTVAEVEIFWSSGTTIMNAWSGSGTAPNTINAVPSVNLGLTASSTVNKSITLVSGQGIYKTGATGAATAHGYDIGIEERSVEA